MGFIRAMMRSCGVRLVILIVVLVVVGVGAAVVAVVKTVQLQQAQGAATSRFGAKVIALCSSPSSSVSGTTSGGKLIFLNAADNTLYDFYNQALPADRQAKDQSDITTVACMVDNQITFDTDEYGSDSNSVEYYCARYERDQKAFLIDVKTGKTVAYQEFVGAKPPECPDKISESTSVTGELPPAADVVQWATGT